MDIKTNNQENSSIDADWCFFKGYPIEAIDQCIPKVNIRNKLTPPWIDAEVVRASELKDQAYKRAKKRSNPQNWNIFKEQRKNVKLMVQCKYRLYMSHLTDELKTDPKVFGHLLET